MDHFAIACFMVTSVASFTFVQVSEPSLLIFSSFRKHAYSDILKKFTTKKGKFSDKKIDIFHIPAQNINCGNS